MHCYSVYISIQKYLKLHKNGVQNGARHFEGAARRRPKAAVEERQRDFRKEVEAAEPPAGAEGAGRVPLKGAVSAADWG